MDALDRFLIFNVIAHDKKIMLLIWVGHVARMGERRGVCRVFVGKPDGKRPLGKTRLRREDNIKMDFQEVGCGGYVLDRAGSGKGQVLGTCECSNEPSGSIKYGEFLD